VLSSCDSQLGKDLRGEGLVGLVRGFFYAGSRRVVASLWKVDDIATKELMVRFYSKIFQGGQTPAAALRAAQVEMSRLPDWRSPYYWAAFVLQGEWH
jgi:CHAT domain-containing protein